MPGFSLEDFDQHIENLRTQLQYLNEGLDATDHNAPDWLAADLISLRNKSGRLQDDMKRFRDQLQSEGLAVKKAKTSNKRLSIEGTKPPTPIPTKETPKTPSQAMSPPVDQSATPRAKPAQTDNGYVTEHIDVTEEVNRRLQESRLRRLMETPSTAHKRKRDALEEPRSDSAAENEGEERSRHGYSGSEYDGTPTKRLKSSGTFEQMLKRKEDGNGQSGGAEGSRFPDRENVKRRRV
ncbi:hypothetical protein CC86DRAFT_448539 [Ophiobolus disseminans]|uniref:Uncharacterized protein n=1 Tax=Ophiobolus disseminans TaxID=1469910 RepID=A0A6A6ZP41_9PLEO|nr:hypothetical protein CC86DRAFT_448539 [Ophiobolus disseminans]